MSHKKQLMSLPEEMIIEIFSKLSPKPLGRLKCVCKTWCFLISSPQFMKKRVSVPATRALHQPDKTIKSSSFHHICEERFFSSLGHDHNPMTRPPKIKTIGFCNGLVCLCINKSVLYVLNLCTREQIRLTEPCSNNNCSVIYDSFCYYHEYDDYMVVKLITAYVKIYSLRKDSWTSIDCSHFEVNRVESSVVVSGALIWGVRRGSDNCWIILSLDFKTMSLLEIPQPNYEDSSTSNQLLKVLDGCLCVLCETGKICIDIWMMKEYGVEGSWVKKVTVPYPTKFISTFGGDPKIKKLCNSGLLLQFGSKRIFFNFENNSFDDASIDGVQECRDGADAYMESIVSPKAYRGIGFDHHDHF